jgi:hypothetical protein
MRRHVGVLLAVTLFAVLVMGVRPVDAQQWKIFLAGKTEPIVADVYVEDAPWIIFRDDESMYLFAIGCNRVDRVERNGVALPRPACPVERLSTSMPLVYLALVELEGKRFEDAFTRLAAQSKQYSEAVLGAELVLTQAPPGDLQARVAAVTRERLRDTATVIQREVNTTLFEIGLLEERMKRLFEAARSFPEGARQRFFFAPR